MNIKLHDSTTLLGSTLKRKRDEIASSQSEDEEMASDEEFGWTGDNNIILGGEEAPIPD